MSVPLPRNTSKLWRAVAAANDDPAAVVSAIDALPRIKRLIRPPSFLPFLVWEYALSELALYLPNPFTLIDAGRDWQELRGSVDAIDLGLSWLGYAAAFEAAPPERRWWNTFQLILATLPAVDAPDLERIEGIAQLSVPRRSRFRRGVHVYDAPAAELDWTMIDECLLDEESGVIATSGTRFWDEAAIWSFGRVSEVEHLLTEAEGTAIGNWIEEAEELPWVALDYPWVTADFPWMAEPAVVRRALMAAWFTTQPPLFAVLKDGAGGAIGFRRCRAVRPVAASAGGAYLFDGTAYDPAAGGGRLYVEAMTDFEDDDLVGAEEIALRVGGEIVGVPPGRLWLAPGELVGGEDIAVAEVDLPLRRTVREQLKFMVRF